MPFPKNEVRKVCIHDTRALLWERSRSRCFGYPSESPAISWSQVIHLSQVTGALNEAVRGIVTRAVVAHKVRPSVTPLAQNALFRRPQPPECAFP